MTIGQGDAIMIKHSRDARVVELADSLDSGSSAHSGRAGSSPASRTKNAATPTGAAAFFMSGATRLEAEKRGPRGSGGFPGEKEE